MTTSRTLLVELLVEELPPKALAAIGDAFATRLAEGLRKRGLCSADGPVQGFATPRRLAVRLDSVLERSPDQLRRDKVLPVSVAFDAEGRPTQALTRKLAALGAAHVDPSSLERGPDGKHESLFHRYTAPGVCLAEVLQASLPHRRAAIAHALEASAAAVGATLAEHDALLDEVTALVEHPVVYAGQFDEAYLAVPQECLILSMKQHQKYFPLVDAAGRLLPRFLIVSNLRTDDPSDIVRGNERVLRARLADAKFFFDQDRRQPLHERVERLGTVVYHNRLGSQLQRVERIARLASFVAGRLGTDTALVERAARLAKADLVTDMVGEFPELQGIMGMHYARHDGEPEAVALAIEAHYHPRFASDSLPAGSVSAAVALADKMDTLVGIYGIGLVPTGDKDPFGLRRAALGVLRILMDTPLPLDLLDLLRAARSGFPADTLSDSVASDLHTFMLERLRHTLRDRGFEAGTVDAVIAQNPVRIDQVLPRVEAVRAFLEMPEAASLAAANKRIRNILRKSDGATGQPDPGRMPEQAERALFQALVDLEPGVSAAVETERYTDALRQLASVREAVDRFFDDVMVMAEDAAVRANRLALLARLESLMNRVADISRLAA